MTELELELADAGEWVLRLAEVDDPGVGVTPELAPPGGFEWRVLSLHFALTTSAAAGSRRPYLDLTHGEQSLLVIPTPAVLAPSEFARFNFAVELGEGGGSVAQQRVLVPLPRLHLAPGYRVAMLCDNFDAGDVFQGVRALVYERMTGAPRRVEAASEMVEPRFDIAGASA